MNFGNIVGQTLDGKYKIEKELGKGGMGAVYLSTHLGTERPVAVKVIVPEFMERTEFVERFRREARAAGRLRHPNVVDVTDFGIADTSFGQVAYLVMEYLDGCTLGEILDEEKNLPLDWTLDILEQVCSAVQEAHSQGIIHRDLKPDNIWLEPNQRGGYTVKVLDFGIAKLEEQIEEEIIGEIIAAETEENYKKNHPARATLTDLTSSKTLADDGGKTKISESATIIKRDEPRTLISEAGTLIQNGEREDENKTAILSADDNAAAKSDDFAGTKLMLSAMLTDKSVKKSFSTDKTSLEKKTTRELTRIGAVLGTPLYMSPEQCRGERLDARSDIYSLGVILYQMLSGKMPFAGDFNEVMLAHQTVEPPPLDAKKVPKKLKQIVLQSLAKNPDERPQTAEAFASKIRANSEGIGQLLTRASVIYSQRLPKFLLLALLTAIPLIILTFARVIFNFLVAVEVFEEGWKTLLVSALLGISAFFVQIFVAAFMVGMTTWIVAQVLAVPLRPISLKAAFRKAKMRWKPLLGTVTVSTLLAIIGLAFCFIPGVLLSARFMLVAPSIMMEGLSGRKAFRRSAELVKRSYRTVLATALLVYFIPGFLAITTALAVNGMLRNFEPKIETPPETARSIEQNKNKENSGLNFSLNKGNFQISTGEKKKDRSMGEKIRDSLKEGIFEILWSPIAILISSFTSVITALIYFKTRQAGGETMQDLLREFEDTDKPQSRWQKRIQERLEQSGRISSFQ